LDIYGKDEKENLSADDKRMLATFASDVQAETRAAIASPRKQK
jgi:hypothetical protein